MDLKVRNWSTKGACKIIFFVYSVLASPKNASYFSVDIFDARSIKPAAVMRMCLLLNFS